MADFYWMGGTDSLASKFQNWSASSGGSALASWPGGSPGASDNFFFNSASAVHCTWESSVVSMATIQSIQQSLTAPYTGILNMTITPTMQGLILNAELQGSGVITLTGANLTALNDSASRKRYVLNGQFAKVSAYTGGYKILPAQQATYLDNGPYPAMTLDTQSLTLAYNVPTATTHDHADDATIHIKGAFVANLASGFIRIGAPNMSEDTKVKIKFDNPSITYSASNLDFNMATASFRGTEIPVTGSQTYGSVAAGITVRHYGVIVFAGTPGEVCTIRNQTTLECYSLEVKAGAVFRAQGQGTNKPAKVNVQTQPIIKGVWAFHANDGHSYLSPKQSFVANVASGGTGRDTVTANSLLMGNAAGAMQNLVEINPGTNGHVLTMVGGTPAWAASSGGGGGMTSFTVAGTSGSSQTITDGNTLTIAAGTGITTTGSATDTVTIASTITQYTNANAIAAVEGEATLALTGDVSMAAGKTLNVAGTIRSAPLIDLPILGGDANGDLHASGITVRDEGSPLGNANSVTQFDFVGAGVVASRSSATDPVVTVTVAGGGGGGTTAMITSTNVASCPNPGGTITTTGDSRQIAYVNGDPGAPITVTNPTADGIRLSIQSLTGFTTGAVSALTFASPVLSTVNGLVNSGALSSHSNAELIWKTNSLIDPTGDPGESPISGWHLVSSQNFRSWDQAGLVI